ncbi:hypothetical protein AgCh_024590 [Apium graveolens]
MSGLSHLDLSSNQLNGTIPKFISEMKNLKFLNLEKNKFHGVMPFNGSFIKRLVVFKIGGNSDLCYNHTLLSKKLKLGIAACDKHGLPIPPPPAKEDSSSDYSDTSEDDSDEDESDGNYDDHHGPSKVVIVVAVGLSSIVFLVIFFIVLLSVIRSCSYLDMVFCTFKLGVRLRNPRPVCWAKLGVFGIAVADSNSSFSLKNS